MEKIKQRSITSFILSTLINLGIGLVVGLIYATIVVVSTKTSAIWETFYSVTLENVLIFGLFAANIYRVVFYYRLSLDIDAVCKGDGYETESSALSLAWSILTLGVYNIFWVYRLAKRLRANAPRYGLKMLETGKDIAVLNSFSFGFIGAWELMKYMNRIARVYNQSGLPEVVGGVQ